ncbi:MAG: YHS domain-containing protein [Planctomycetota bacterium]
MAGARIETTRDPVCGMNVAAGGTSKTASYEGKNYYFCSEECKNTFQANPEQYAEQDEQEQESGG